MSNASVVTYRSVNEYFPEERHCCKDDDDNCSERNTCDDEGCSRLRFIECVHQDSTHKLNVDTDRERRMRGRLRKTASGFMPPLRNVAF